MSSAEEKQLQPRYEHEDEELNYTRLLQTTAPAPSDQHEAPRAGQRSSAIHNNLHGCVCARLSLSKLDLVKGKRQEKPFIHSFLFSVDTRAVHVRSGTFLSYYCYAWSK